jgi:hypothetical protein
MPSRVFRWIDIWFSTKAESITSETYFLSNSEYCRPIF